jgi:hypothetical protein
MEAINKEAIIPNGTVLTRQGERFEIVGFEAQYYLKELDRGNVGNRRIVIPADNISEFTTTNEKAKTYDELRQENALLRGKVEKLKSQIHTGFRGNS